MKSNIVRVQPQGEWSLIVSSLLIWELDDKNNFSVDYGRTKENIDIIEYIKATPEKGYSSTSIIIG
jgi:hypothetical protein